MGFESRFIRLGFVRQAVIVLCGMLVLLARPGIVRSEKGLPSTSSETGEAGKLPVPDAAALKDATRLVEDVYKAEFARAKTVEELLSLSKNLVESSASETDRGRQFAMLVAAREMAVRARDTDVVLAVIDGTAKTFQIDAFAMKVQALSVLSKSLKTSAEKLKFVVAANALTDSMVEASRFDTAEQVCGLTVNLAKDVDPALGRNELSLIRQVKEAKALYAEATRATDVLSQKPNDPAANLVVGKYRCFVANDWAVGLGLLSRGSVEALRKVAAKELAGVGDAKEMGGVADDWWAAGAKLPGIAGTRMQGHAGSLYQRALPDLTGLAKSQAQNRIASLITGQTRTVGDVTWISQAATYTVSSMDRPERKPLPSLLNGKGGGYDDSFAFHTMDEEHPFIIIDLGAAARVTRMEIVNRRGSNGGRAKTLTAWAGLTNEGPWTQIWEAKGEEAEWDVDIQEAVAARFVKLGLTEHVAFHLFSVKIMGVAGAGVSLPKR